MSREPMAEGSTFDAVTGEWSVDLAELRALVTMLDAPDPRDNVCFEDLSAIGAVGPDGRPHAELRDLLVLVRDAPLVVRVARADASGVRVTHLFATVDGVLCHRQHGDRAADLAACRPDQIASLLLGLLGVTTVRPRVEGEATLPPSPDEPQLMRWTLEARWGRDETPPLHLAGCSVPGTGSWETELEADASRPTIGPALPHRELWRLLTGIQSTVFHDRDPDGGNR